MTDEKIQQLNEFRFFYDRMKPEYQKALKHVNDFVQGQLDEASRMAAAGAAQPADRQSQVGETGYDRQPL